MLPPHLPQQRPRTSRIEKAAPTRQGSAKPREATAGPALKGPLRVLSPKMKTLRIRSSKPDGTPC